MFKGYTPFTVVIKILAIFPVLYNVSLPVVYFIQSGWLLLDGWGPPEHMVCLWGLSLSPCGAHGGPSCPGGWDSGVVSGVRWVGSPLDLWIFSWGCFLLKPRSKPIWRVSSLRFPRMERQKEYLQFPLVDRHNNHQRTWNWSQNLCQTKRNKLHRELSPDFLAAVVAALVIVFLGSIFLFFLWKMSHCWLSIM